MWKNLQSVVEQAKLTVTDVGQLTADESTLSLLLVLAVAAAITWMWFLVKPFFVKHPDNHLSVVIEGSKIILPPLTSAVVRKDALKAPNSESVVRFLWLGLLFIFSIHGLVMVSGLSKLETLPGSDLAAMQVGTLSVLFPWVILILGEKKSSANSIFSDHEILIRHSWAYPASMVLPILSTYFLLGRLIHTSAYAESILTLVSLAILIFVTYKLLELTFSPTVKKMAEDELLRVKISQYAGGVTADRVGMAMTHAKAQEPEYSIKADVLSWIDRGDQAGTYSIHVPPPMSGKINSIDFGILRKLRITIESYNEQRSSSSENLIDSQDSRDADRKDYSIRLTAYIGKYLSADSGDSLFVLTLPESLRDSDTEQRFKQRGISAFKFADPGNCDESRSIYDGICESIYDVGKLAIDNKSLHSLKVMIGHYQSLYTALCTILPEIAREVGNNDSYNLSVNPFFHSGPLDQFSEDLTELLHKMLKSTEHSDKFVSTFLYIPYYLGSDAVSRNDVPALSKFLSMNTIQVYEMKKFAADSHKDAWIGIVLQWTESLVKYSINSVLKRTLDEQLATQLSRQTSWRLQHLGKEFIDDGKLTYFTKVLETVHFLGGALVEKYQTSLDDQRLYGQAFACNDRSSETSSSRARNILQMQNEAVLAWSWYVLYLLEKNPSAEVKSSLSGILSRCFDALPSRFEDVFRFHIEFERHERFDRWDWVGWETHPAGQAFHPENGRYTDRVFTALFARSSIDDANVLQNLGPELRRQGIYKLEKPSGEVHSNLKTIDRRPEFAFLSTDKAHLDKVESLLDKVVSIAIDSEYAQIASQEVNTQKLNEAKDNFREAFYESAILRQYFNVDVNDDSKIRPDFLGTNQLIERDIFAEKNGKLHAEFARHLGHDVGRYEDLYVYNKLIEFTATDSVNSDIDSNVLALLQLGCVENDIIFVTNGYPKHLRNSGKIRYLATGNRQAVYQYGTSEIPIVNITGPAKVKNTFFVLDKSSVSIKNPVEFEDQPKLLSDTAFSFTLSDPATDISLRQRILKENPSWLRGNTPAEREKFAALQLLLSIQERIRVTIQNPSRVKRINFAS